MSFQAYLTNIENKTGRSPADFQRLTTEKGFAEDKILKPGVKAGQIVEWLKGEFDLGHGHAMAIYALLSGKKKPGDA